MEVLGRELTIKGEHEECQNSGLHISRSFVCKYTLPEDVNIDELRSFFTMDGKLTIETPKRDIDAPLARIIPIQNV